jgi:hypothetical protein
MRPIVQPDSSEIKQQHLTEYAQLCETYRLGFRSILEITRFYMMWHGGLAVALFFTLSHEELKNFGVSFFGVKILITVISLLGFLAGFGAIGMSMRYEDFHNAMSPRAIDLERLYDMRFLTDLEAARNKPSFLGAASIALILFLLLAGSWAIFLFFSFIP